MSTDKYTEINLAAEEAAMADDNWRPAPVEQAAEVVSDRLFELLDAQDALQKAFLKVPNYTGQYDEGFFVRIEQEVFNRARENFADAMADYMSSPKRRDPFKSVFASMKDEVKA